VWYRRRASEPYRNCGYDRGFALSFGNATPTERLKTGAGQFKRLATPWTRRVLRPTDQGDSHPSFAHSPIHRHAHSPFRCRLPHPNRPEPHRRIGNPVLRCDQLDFSGGFLRSKFKDREDGVNGFLESDR
jgi:hypothetical protein